jgi:hypothetical protein
VSELRLGVAIALVTLGLSGLAWDAIQWVRPLPAALARARGAFETPALERWLAESHMGFDADFTRQVFEGDAAWPLDRDVVLRVNPGLGAKLVDSYRIRAAFVLAPRRVVVRHERMGAQTPVDLALEAP